MIQKINKLRNNKLFLTELCRIKFLRFWKLNNMLLLLGIASLLGVLFLFFSNYSLEKMLKSIEFISASPGLSGLIILCCFPIGFLLLVTVVGLIVKMFQEEQN
jgi:hypothetical protein